MFLRLDDLYCKFNLHFVWLFASISYVKCLLPICVGIRVKVFKKHYTKLLFVGYAHSHGRIYCFQHRGIYYSYYIGCKFDTDGISCLAIMFSWSVRGRHYQTPTLTRVYVGMSNTVEILHVHVCVCRFLSFAGGVDTICKNSPFNNLTWPYIIFLYRTNGFSSSIFHCCGCDFLLSLLLFICYSIIQAVRREFSIKSTTVSRKNPNLSIYGTVLPLLHVSAILSIKTHSTITS